ncbi:MAG: 4-(cytidine 5'-diphospho)-2-C-methyl-D-erythritol kinase [Chloroflexota bacterium]|nr:4-(cytidine 5'-diphospho)-2-C-methyl-D-erythritol kinase [Chloroflexota bacterium]
MRRDEPWPSRWVASDGRLVRPQRVTRAEALAGIRAPAKLNLGLAVTGRRTDGYHNLVSLMVSLDLADTIRVEPARAFTLSCDDPALAGDENLALRAARAFQSATGERRAAHITLAKRIPVAAGLGGGSSDAAATLLALDALWGTNVSDGMLLRIARDLGADVPFALYGGAMIARGIGDVLTPAPLPHAWLALVMPRAAIPHKTAALYGSLTEAAFGAGGMILQQVAGLRRGEPLDPALLDNPFLPPLERIAPAVREAREQIARLGQRAFLTGSGPTLYVLCENEDETECRADAYRALLDAAIRVTRTDTERNARESRIV